MASQDHKESRDQLGPLAIQAQMVFLELMDRLELQEEMVRWDNLVSQDSGVCLDQWAHPEDQEVLGLQEIRELKALLDRQDLQEHRAQVEVLVVKVLQVLQVHKDHRENLDKMVQEDHLYVNFCNTALVDPFMNTYLYAHMHIKHTHTYTHTLGERCQLMCAC